MTRAKAKKMKECLNGLIKEAWAKSHKQFGLVNLEESQKQLRQNIRNIIQVQVQQD